MQIEINGLSISELANQFGLSATTIHFFLKKEKPTDSQIMDFLKSYQETQMTTLEYKLSQIQEATRFNKKPAQLSKRYLPDFQLNSSTFINTDGLYWHCELKLNKHYHFDMRLAFEEAGLRLLQFREDEVNFKFPIVESMINNLLNKSVKVYARKTVIKEVAQSEATDFLKKNHIMGNYRSKHVGLYQDQTLVCLFSYKVYKDKLKVERFCSLINHTIVGGFSKLLKHVEKLHPNLPIHYWVDLRYGTGNFLLNQGFVKDHDTLGWKWTDFKNTYNRLKCRANMDERKLTQAEHAAELKLYKIYDAGQRLYIKNH